MMTLLVLAFVLLQALAPYHHSAGYSQVLLPDPALTPGVIRTTDAKSLCAPGFTTKAYRHTTAKMKCQVYGEYGIRGPGCPESDHLQIAHTGDFEVDHLVPLEIGGGDDVKNLWPQPYAAPGAHEKDRLENWLHAQVCAGKVPIAEAQDELEHDWYANFLKNGLDKNPKLGRYIPRLRRTASTPDR